MKRLFIVFIFVVLSGCMSTQHADIVEPYIGLGSSSPKYVFVYLCGLVQETDSEKYSSYQILDRLGKRLDVRFLAITPTHRCSALDNKLCWPSHNKEELLRTYNEINQAIGSQKVDGFIGFSNGGFFLNRLVQFIELDKPVITIGAAGPYYGHAKKNSLHLLIGNKDEFHYEHAKKFYADAQQSLLTIKLYEYAGGHEIPEALLEKVFLTITRRK
jgi:hypothetical protein